MACDLKAGDRVLVFDHLLYVDDVKTPKSVTMKPATVVARYTQRNLINIERPWRESEELIDVDFDHRGLSKGHFPEFVEKINAAR